MSPTVGVIGLGVMGEPMAGRLLAAGWRVVVHNRSRGAVERLRAAGAFAADSPAEVARRAPAVITMLPSPAAVESVVLGAGGLLAAAEPRTLLVEMSTSTPGLAIRTHACLRARGAAALDAPVSGGEGGARAGTLSVMAGGDADAVARARPLLDVLAARITHVGGPGAGQTAKAANQVVVALNIQAVAEALALARDAGVDPALVREAMRGGFADSTALEVHGDRMLRASYRPGAAMRLHLKDLRIALDVAGAHGTRLPAAEGVTARMAACVAAGGGDRDHAALALAYQPAAVTPHNVPGQEPR